MTILVYHISVMLYFMRCSLHILFVDLSDQVVSLQENLNIVSMISLNCAYIFLSMVLKLSQCKVKLKTRVYHYEIFTSRRGFSYV